MRIHISLSSLFAGLAAVPSAQARKIKVFPGDSIQAAIDAAQPGDRIEVRPGIYQEDPSSTYGLRISTPHLRLYAKEGPGSVRLLHNGDQRVGLFAAPAGCDDFSSTDCSSRLEGLSLEGLSVEGFPSNGIMTRWVDHFEFIGLYSIDNLRNGIYPTISTNGYITQCKASGSLESGLWVAGSDDVTVTHCELYNNPTGLEVTVANRVYATKNIIHDNQAGIGLYHPNMAGTPLREARDWIFVDNHIYNNNFVSNAPPDSFAAAVPVGVGVLAVGVSYHTIKDNLIEDNESAGILAAGYCTVIEIAFGGDCSNPNFAPINGDASTNNNTYIYNEFMNNGFDPIYDPVVPGADVVYVQSPAELDGAPDLNCYFGNERTDGSDISVHAPFVGGVLPTAGCTACASSSGKKSSTSDKYDVSCIEDDNSPSMGKKSVGKKSVSTKDEASGKKYESQGKKRT